jgi:ATP phosphoribosyltransferase regulatory subunit
MAMTCELARERSLGKNRLHLHRHQDWQVRDKANLGLYQQLYVLCAPSCKDDFQPMVYSKIVKQMTKRTSVVTIQLATRSSAGQVPAGVADYFWGEAYERRQLEATLLDLFRRWGYGDVVTPAFEYADTLSARSNRALQAELCRFLDRDGSMLALRADMTIQVARLVGTRLHDAPQPQRFCYAGSVFRDVEPRAGQQREFWQAGVELLGSTAPEADAEVLALTARALEAAGIDHFRLVIGQMQYFEGLLNALELAPDARRRLTQAIDRNSEPELEAFLRETPLSQPQRQVLRETPRLGGVAIEEILQRAEMLALNTTMRQAIANLRSICDALAAFDVLERIALDLSEIHNLGYYTGITFEALAPGVGFRIASGGRYDDLVGTFGAPMPAVGVALGLERVLLARRRGASASPPRPLSPDLLVATGNHRAAVEFVEQARSCGLVVVLDLEQRSSADLCAYASAVGAHTALDWTAATPVIFDCVEQEAAATPATHETLNLLLTNLLARRETHGVLAEKEARP